MRIWSLHPSYLDAKGIVALWRETLLAQNVLAGNTKGYKNHPQLNRFKAHKEPLQAIGSYLVEIYTEAKKRGYNFDKNKILFSGNNAEKISVTTGQVKYEFEHLKRKLEKRDPKKLDNIGKTKEIKTHPIFTLKEGKIEEWEIS